MNTDVITPTTLQPFVLEMDAVYPIDLAARLAHMPRHKILVCCKRGIVAPMIDPDDGRYTFDAATIRVLQRIEYLHTECGVNFTGIQIILSLADEVERFRARET
ncbi:MAG TPA: MerR family transcriptional regulator [Opitutus sp.]|nr:MerR family transcriptional regulator [Opitutus sp.]